MGNIYTSIDQLVGNTPLLELKNIGCANARLLAKLEYLNPAGSVKCAEPAGFLLYNK